MQVERSEVFVEGEQRLREAYGNLLELAKDLGVRGQLQPVLIREFDEEEDPEAVEGGYQWKLVDGGRRFLAFEIAEKNDIEIPYVKPGHIEAYVQGDGRMSPLDALEAEFHANDERKNFTWREKAVYVRRIHEMHSRQEDEWSVPHTANILDMSEQATYKYLQLTESEEIFNATEVKEAESFRVAYKKHTILKDHKRRQREVAVRKKTLKKAREEKKKESDDAISDDELAALNEMEDPGDTEVEDSFTPDFDNVSDMSLELVNHGDCIEWFGRVPDDHFDWAHWDPPYGGRQKGGAFATHKDIDDSWMKASALMRAGIPEIWRVLKRGHWLVLWCHPTRINWLATYLRGHVKDPENDWCQHCEKPWKIDQLTEVCFANPEWCFWVNKYPNVWYKTDRKSDGHEIRRYGVNTYETFLLAAKVEEKEDDPVLVRNDWRNVFPYEGVTHADRRHSMHKPADLLAEILSIISVKGAYGVDPSAGSGSIIEAALYTDRRVSVVEADEDFANVCVEVADRVIEERGIVEL